MIHRALTLSKSETGVDHRSSTPARSAACRPARDADLSGARRYRGQSKNFLPQIGPRHGSEFPETRIPWTRESQYRAARQVDANPASGLHRRVCRSAAGRHRQRRRAYLGRMPRSPPPVRPDHRRLRIRRYQTFMARRPIPSASVQNESELCIRSTTSRAALTNLSTCSSVTTSGGATFRTMKLLPQTCVRMPWSR